MCKNKIKNIAIVGAGIIGLYLGWKLKEKGHKITIFERKENIWDKPCSGLISERIKKFIPLEESLIEKEIKYVSIHFPKKTITLKLKPTHFAINRQALSEKLLCLAQSCGVKVLFSQEVKGIPDNFDKVIGCDGALSKIREKLNLPGPCFRLGLQSFRETKDFSNYVEAWPVKSGFCWKIPKGKKTEYGIIGNPESAKKEFKNFLRDKIFHISEHKEQIRAALIPQGLILPKTKNITLCGDAAGLTKPWSGGGLIWGLTAAEILLKHFPDFEKYHKEVKRFFGPKIFKAKFATSLAYFLGNNFPFVLPSNITRDNDFPLF